MVLKISKNLVIISTVFYLTACDKGEQSSSANVPAAEDTQPSSAVAPMESKPQEPMPISTTPQNTPLEPATVPTPKDESKNVSAEETNTVTPTPPEKSINSPLVTPPVSGGVPENTPMEAKQGQSQEDTLKVCRSMIQNLGNDGIKTLKGSKADRYKREAQFLPLFVKNFDVKRIAKFVLGKYGRGNILPGEFEEFLVIFQKTIVSIYANRLGNYDDERFVVNDATFLIDKADEKMVAVKSQVISKNRAPINIAWTIVIKDGTKGIVDVGIENVSQAQTQRQEYADILNNGGIKELIKQLNIKYEKSSNATKS